jgi:hypothetical protein
MYFYCKFLSTWLIKYRLDPVYPTPKRLIIYPAQYESKLLERWNKDLALDDALSVSARYV